MFLTAFDVIDLGNRTSLLRVFRLGRLLRLVHRAETLRTILDTFLLTLPSIANIGLLLGLLIFIYIVFGMEQFSYIQWQTHLNNDANFETFSSSFFLLLRISTGEGWNFIMDDLTR